MSLAALIPPPYDLCPHCGADAFGVSSVFVTGISKSTLSRLESGQRKPSLELLLPIAKAHGIPLDELVVAEFDTRVPHWFGAAGDRPVEILSIRGREGERIHVRAAPRRKPADR